MWFIVLFSVMMLIILGLLVTILWLLDQLEKLQYGLIDKSFNSFMKKLRAKEVSSDAKD
jgi:hypothetical protein